MAPEVATARGLASDKAILHIKSFDWTPPRVLPTVPYPRRSVRPARKAVEAAAVSRIVRIIHVVSQRHAKESACRSAPHAGCDDHGGHPSSQSSAFFSALSV